LRWPVGKGESATELWPEAGEGAPLRGRNGGGKPARPATEELPATFVLKDGLGKLNFGEGEMAEAGADSAMRFRAGAAALGGALLRDIIPAIALAACAPSTLLHCFM
jgi:hypothetical protein